MGHPNAEPPRRHEPELGVRVAECRVLGRDDDVRCEQQLEGAGVGNAVDRGDERLRDGVQRLDGLHLQPTFVVPPPLVNEPPRTSLPALNARSPAAVRMSTLMSLSLRMARAISFSRSKTGTLSEFIEPCRCARLRVVAPAPAPAHLQCAQAGERVQEGREGAAGAPDG